ncbi:MAG: LruC domain-containing protein, partial [Pyrinomonadaceae bacterium]|nr:LruC domain-containing protein [Sphingobacteriaceae bacterium]
MKIHHCITSIFILFNILLISCVKDPMSGTKSKENSAKIAPDGFNFETSRNVNVSITLLSNIDEPLKGIIIDINSTKGETLLRGASNENGVFTGSINIPSYIDTLLIRPDNTGLNQNVKALIVNNNITCTIGGVSGSSGNVLMATSGGKAFSGPNFKTFAQTAYTYMGTYESSGRPLSYLDPQKGNVSAALINYLGESLPERQDVRIHHPQYLSNNATEHLNIVQPSEVWITFVSEGAGNLNSVGYYTYPTNNPPNNASKINEIKYLFPNASAGGSGGGMQTGDRVKLGSFQAGISIGFVLISSGWNPNLNAVNKNNTHFYSDSPFNPEGSAALQTHTVLLHYAQENQFIIGFEDLPRDNPNCDQDFNDVILYAISNPATGISTAGVNTISVPADTDGDGVYDVNDKFPSDPTKAYITFFPSQTTKGTLAFEDNWPKKGDYDMNDLVINYRYSYVSNAANKVVEMTGEFVAVAAWALNKNGFGIQFPFAQNLVSNIVGQKLTDNYITLNANGT